MGGGALESYLAPRSALRAALRCAFAYFFIAFRCFFEAFFRSLFCCLADFLETSPELRAHSATPGLCARRSAMSLFVDRGFQGD